jgi:hypothetical protein
MALLGRPGGAIGFRIGRPPPGSGRRGRRKGPAAAAEPPGTGRGGRRKAPAAAAEPPGTGRGGRRKGPAAAGERPASGPGGSRGALSMRAQDRGVKAVTASPNAALLAGHAWRGEVTDSSNGWGPSEVFSRATSSRTCSFPVPGRS